MGMEAIYSRALKQACALLAIANGAETKRDPNKEDHIQVVRSDVERQLQLILQAVIAAEHKERCTDPYVCVDDRGKIEGCNYHIAKATDDAVWQAWTN